MKIYFIVLYLLVHSSLSFAQNKSIEKSGDYLQIMLASSAGISTLFNKKEEKAILEFVKVFGAMEISTHATKMIINKQRPNGGNHAFPSGHTAASFMGASFLQKKYGWDVGIPCYLLASYVGYSRIQARKHDLVDVLAGAGVGVASTYVFTKPIGKKQKINLHVTTNEASVVIEASMILQ